MIKKTKIQGLYQIYAHVLFIFVKLALLCYYRKSRNFSVSKIEHFILTNWIFDM